MSTKKEPSVAPIRRSVSVSWPQGGSVPPFHAGLRQMVALL